MELGNFCFGHSRGAWPIPRHEGYEQPLEKLAEAMYPRDEVDYRFTDEFENEVFAVRGYDWGWEEGEPLPPPNFLHKASGVSVRWYKYPLRDSYASREVPLAEWEAILAECVQSVRKEKAP